MVKYIDQFNDPIVGCYLDPSNVLRYGKDTNTRGADWVRALGKRLLKFDFKGYSYAKGFKVKIGEGDENWPDVLKALDEVGYKDPANGGTGLGDRRSRRRQPRAPEGRRGADGQGAGDGVRSSAPLRDAYEETTHAGMTRALVSRTDRGARLRPPLSRPPRDPYDRSNVPIEEQPTDPAAAKIVLVAGDAGVNHAPAITSTSPASPCSTAC